MSAFSQRADLRGAFRQAIASTWVVTSACERKPVGFTAISVISVSIDPPIVSFNLSKTSSSRPTIEASGRVALHLLADHQESIAQRFARDRSRRFVDDGAWHWDATGLPALHDYVHRLEADVLAAHDAGDSLVITAGVTAERPGAGSPLVHHQGGYSSLDRHQTPRPQFTLQEESA